MLNAVLAVFSPLYLQGTLGNGPTERSIERASNWSISPAEQLSWTEQASDLTSSSFSSSIIFQVIFHQLPGCLPSSSWLFSIAIRVLSYDLMTYWSNSVTTPDFTWLLLVIFLHLQVIFHHLQVIFHYLSGCLPATLKYSGTELLTHWLNWVMTHDFTWPHPDYYCSSSIAFQVIFHHLPGCLPLSGKYLVAESLLELSDWSSTMTTFRWYPNFDVVFQVIFHHLPCHLPSCLPSPSTTISHHLPPPSTSWHHLLLFTTICHHLLQPTPL